MNQTDNKVKLCPFRKVMETTHFNYNAFGGSMAPDTVEEYFLPCLGEECMAYCVKGNLITFEDNPSCKLMRS